MAFTSANPGEGVSHTVRFFSEKLGSRNGKPTLVLKAAQVPNLRFTDILDMPAMRMTMVNLWSVLTDAVGGENGNSNGNSHGHGNGVGKLLNREKLRQLESEKGLKLLQSLRPHFDYVLIDCPSISTSYEAATLAPDVDGVVLVVEADRTKRDQIFRARQTIEMAKGSLMGLVLNRRRHVVPEWFYRRL